jgi:hypothetical protein
MLCEIEGEPMILAKLFPWFPLAGKASDFIVILLAVGILTVIAVLVTGKRRKSGRDK